MMKMEYDQDALKRAFARHDLARRVATLAKARAAMAYQNAAIAAHEAQLAVGAETKACEAIYDIAHGLPWEKGK